MMLSDICLSDVCLSRTSGLSREQRGLRDRAGSATYQVTDPELALTLNLTITLFLTLTRTLF